MMKEKNGAEGAGVAVFLRHFSMPAPLPAIRLFDNLKTLKPETQIASAAMMPVKICFFLLTNFLMMKTECKKIDNRND